MDRNNCIEIHPTQAQIAKISYHYPSKYLNQNVSPQLQCLLFRIMCLFSEKWVCMQVLNDHNLVIYFRKKNNVNESAYRELTVFCDGLPRKYLVSQCREDINNLDG
jgi:hypothetical protein